MNTLKLVAKEVTEDMIITALLHDVLEDTDCPYDTLYNIFGSEVFESVMCVTKRKCISNDEYVESIVRHKTPRIVKYADSLFNHQECVKVGDTRRAEKYQRNLQQLYSKELFKC